MLGLILVGLAVGVAGAPHEHHTESQMYQGILFIRKLLPS